MGTRIYEKGLDKRTDPRGRTYYWYKGGIPDGIPDAGTDIAAIKTGLISVTPINLDLTDYAFMGQLADWKFAQPTPMNPHDL